MYSVSLGLTLNGPVERLERLHLDFLCFSQDVLKQHISESHSPFGTVLVVYLWFDAARSFWELRVRVSISVSG